MTPGSCSACGAMSSRWSVLQEFRLLSPDAFWLFQLSPGMPPPAGLHLIVGDPVFLQSSPLHHYLFVACPGTCSTSSHPARGIWHLRVFSFAWRFSFAIAFRISFIPFSTHSQSVCMHVGKSDARMAHVAASSSPLTDVWPVRALIEKCMFNLLSFEK